MPSLHDIDQLAEKVADRVGTQTGKHDLRALIAAVDKQSRGKGSNINWAAWSVIIAALSGLGGAIVWGSERSIDHEHRLTVIESKQIEIDRLRDSVDKLTNAVQHLQIELAKGRSK